MLSAVCDAQPAEGIFQLLSREHCRTCLQSKGITRKRRHTAEGKADYQLFPNSSFGPAMRSVLYISDRKIPIFDWLYHLLYAMIVL